MERTLGPRRSSCLRFQLFRVEMCSFLPDDESDGRNLSRQGEASHCWLHAFREQALVEVVERSLLAAGHTRRRVENPSRRNVGGLRIGLFNPIAEALEFPDHSGGAVSL
jgi:hypothetical protein